MTRTLGTTNKQIGELRTAAVNHMKAIHAEIKSTIDAAMVTEQEHTIYKLLDINLNLEKLRQSLEPLMANEHLDEQTLNQLCSEEIDYALEGSLDYKNLYDALLSLKTTFAVAPLKLTNTSERLVGRVTVDERADLHKGSSVDQRPTTLSKPNYTTKVGGKTNKDSIQSEDKENDEGNIHIRDSHL